MREGWTVTNRPVEDLDELAERLRAEHFDIVGLSLSGETLIDTLFVVYSLSFGRNRETARVKVIVGGHFLSNARN